MLIAYMYAVYVVDCRVYSTANCLTASRHGVGCHISAVDTVSHIDDC